MPLPEITLPIANMCLTLHPMGKLFNSLREFLHNKILEMNAGIIDITETCCK